MQTPVYKIPHKTNIIITVVCTLLYFLLLWAASHTNSFLLVVLYAVLFAIMMVPVYSLIHEAEHNIFHPSEQLNNFWGRWLCTLFIVPFTFFRHCHLNHHKKNRTDEEMWDLYYEHEVKWKRYGNLYLMMMGFGYFALWLAVLLFAFAPRLLYTRFFLSHKEIAGFLKNSNMKHKLQRSFIESWVVIVFQAGIFYLLDLNFLCWVFLFSIHGLLWASQNYVNHAFSPRDIINGAHNLKMPVAAKWIYLNFNLHLAHHQNPNVPWVHLPSFIRSGKERISFLRNYLRLWKGPRVTHEPDPGKIKAENSVPPDF